MSYIGDFALGKTFDTKFTTVNTSGVPTTLAGSPVISAYADNGTTEITAGITLTVDFDSRTGMHNVRVVATSGNGYASGSNYQLVITTGTVGGSSVVGYVIAEFSIEARSAVRPTTADRTLDVSAGGEAGLDWANVGSPTTAVDLSGTTIKTTQKVDVETIKTNAVVNGGTITFPTNATLASTTNITAGIITTAANVTTVNGLAANVITATSIAADAITAAKIADGAIDAATFATGAIDATAIAADAIGSSELATSAITEIQSGLSTLDAAGIRSAVGLASANLDTQLDVLPTANENADAYLDRVNAIETGLTVRQAHRLEVAAAAGKLSGAATTTVAIRNAVADSKDRITATVDSNGNRTAITTDVT